MGRTLYYRTMHLRKAVFAVLVAAGAAAGQGVSPEEADYSTSGVPQGDLHGPPTGPS